MANNILRNLPSVSELLESPPLRSLVDRVSRNVVVSRARTILDDLRSEAQSAAAEIKAPSLAEIAERIATRILAEERPAMRAVVNATGVILHTGLGRSPLAEEAIAEIAAAARDYVSVEVDLATGNRSQRMAAVEGLLREATGAEAALVVNNNAGATLLALAALAAGREVIVSRGELIEIGGSYRLPDVMQASGVRLREVGTTNKTRIDDYRRAIGPETAALMLVHSSNFVVVGFTEQTPLAELVKLGRSQNLPVIHDIGSGALIDFAQFGCSGEPVARNSIEQGADLVLFSGDKLLGGPQCGVAVGRRALVEQLLRHPLARALRVDKLTLAGMAATLRLYRQPATARQAIPLLRLLDTSLDNLKNRAQRLAPQIAAAAAVASAEAVEDATFLGGGSVPTQRLATWCVAVEPRSMSVDRFAARLRDGATPVVGRIHKDRLHFDLRSVFPRQDVEIVSAVEALAHVSAA